MYKTPKNISQAYLSHRKPNQEQNYSVFPPSERRAYLNFLRENNIDPIPYRSPESQKDYFGNINIKNRGPRHEIKLTSEALHELRLMFKNHYQLFFKHSSQSQKNFENEQKKRKREENILQDLKAKILTKQKHAQSNKKIFLQQKASKMTEIIINEEKIRKKNKLKYKKSLNEAIGKIRQWQSKLQESIQKKNEQLSRVSSASSIHNRRVKKTLFQHQSKQEEQYEKKLVMYSNLTEKKKCIKKKHSFNEHKYRPQTDFDSNSAQIMRSAQLDQSRVSQIIAKNIQKQRSIKKARQTKQQNEQQLKKRKSQRSEESLLKINSNIAEILKTRKARDRILDNKYYTPINSPSHIASPNRIKTLESGDIKLPQLKYSSVHSPPNVYLTEISQINIAYKRNNKNRAKAQFCQKNIVQNMINNYRKHTNPESPSKLQLERKQQEERMVRDNVHGIYRPRDLAQKYQKAMVNKMKSISMMAHCNKIQPKRTGVRINYKPKIY